MNDDAVQVREIDREALRAASDAARAAVTADPADEQAAEALFEAARRAQREIAAVQFRDATPIPPPVAEAARMLQRGEEEPAELLLRRYLKAVPNDPDALLLMADIAMRCGFPEDAEKILRRGVELHPAHGESRLALAKLLNHQARQRDKVHLMEDAVRLLDQAPPGSPENEEALSLKTSMLVILKRYEEAETVIRHRLGTNPENPGAWISFAHLLKTLGRFPEAVAAYRTGIALDPGNGAFWFMLADLKLARFFPADIERMEAALEQPLDDQSRVDLHFALAAAYHQAKRYADGAEQLRLGNALRLRMQPHDIAKTERGLRTAMQVYSSTFFKDRAGAGAQARDPIFVVGMPRSGSTLVEQILSSHPSIEGTAELFAVQQMEGELFQQHPNRGIDEIVGALPTGEFERLGQRYIELTQFHRRTDRPRFTDKNPGNWRQAGFIHAMLPNAKIVDIRRNPLDCCFANYSQHFKLGVNFSYGLEEMASQYSGYVRLMRHFDEVIPGKVHRIIYEDLVENIEDEVRRLFDYLELPFDDACLRFFETERAIHTPSSEQVRQPINRSGIGKWRPYEPWIGELKAALGSTLDHWRD